MTVMPQEDFMLHGLSGDYQVHVDGVTKPLEFLDNSTLRAVSSLWGKLRARYHEVGGGNVSALRILADIEREHAASLCCSSGSSSYWGIEQCAQEQRYKDAASVLRQLLEGESRLDGVPFDIAKAFPVNSAA